MTDCCSSRYDQISGQVKSLDKQAVDKSDQAKKESKMADGMLEDIAKLEQKLPPSLKVRMEKVRK